MKSINPEKSVNTEKILRAFREKQRLTIPQLAETTGISLTTVKKYIAGGLQGATVVPDDFAQSTGGRKPQLYRLNSNYLYYFLIVIDNNDLHFTVLDYCFNVAWQKIVRFEISRYLQTTEDILSEALKKYDRAGAVCFSLPCVVNDGVIADWYYDPAMNGFDFREYIAKKYNIQVIVENDMKLTALARTAVDEYRRSTIATVQFGHNGIGVAAAVDGNILNGCSGFAGEVGYILDSDRDIMSTGHTARIVNALIVFINPEKIFFYGSDKQNNFPEIFDAAVKGLPSYAIPEYSMTQDYLQDITTGLKESIYRHERY